MENKRKKILIACDSYQTLLGFRGKLMEDLLINNDVAVFTPKINQNEIGFARIATIAADNQLWTIDENDFSLKKYDLDGQKIIQKTPLELILKAKDYHINFMREYQNLLYVNDKQSGVLVFDNMGNYKKKIALTGITTFGFINEELYYLKDNKIYFFNVYHFAERSINLPEGINVTNVIVSPDNIYLFSGTNLLICK